MDATHPLSTPAVPSRGPASESPHWREALLTALLATEVALGTLASIPGAYLALRAGRWEIAVVDAVAIALLVLLWRRRTMPHPWRAALSMLVFSGIGVFFLTQAGIYGLLFLSSVPIFTALLMGLVPAALTLVGLSLGILALGIGLELPMSLRFGVITPDSLPDHWMMLTLAFLLVSTIVTVSTAILLRNMEQAMMNARTAQDELRKLALFDVLTGLPNRRMLSDRIGQALVRSRSTGLHGALLFIDLDHFKNINDTRGHGVGDQYLAMVAARLGPYIDPADTLGRLGGDEFLVLLPDLSIGMGEAGHKAMALAEGLRLQMEQPFELDGASYLSSASIGVSLFPRPGQSNDDLMREADTAMYRAKTGGRNRVAFYEDAMQVELQTRVLFEHDLNQALASGQLWVAVQSQCDRHGLPIGGELLIRWNHPVRGNISPVEFIPVAEQCGHIVQMGQWMLEQACMLASAMRERGHGFALSVNISPRQFHQPDFIRSVKAIMAKHQTMGNQLIFEVTEGLLIKDMDETVDRMLALAALGIRFSIDDFGTGYSSLAYLKRLPLYELKIDKAFVDDTPDDANDTAIVQLILSMAAQLHLKVVAEGVETKAQADFLLAHGCDSLQGYYCARPVPLAEWLDGLTLPARHPTIA